MKKNYVWSLIFVSTWSFGKEVYQLKFEDFLDSKFDLSHNYLAVHMREDKSIALTSINIPDNSKTICNSTHETPWEKSFEETFAEVLIPRENKLDHFSRKDGFYHHNVLPQWQGGWTIDSITKKKAFVSRPKDSSSFKVDSTYSITELKSLPLLVLVHEKTNDCWVYEMHNVNLVRDVSNTDQDTENRLYQGSFFLPKPTASRTKKERTFIQLPVFLSPVQESNQKSFIVGAMTRR